MTRRTIALLSTLLLSSVDCEGPVGPNGDPGARGEDGKDGAEGPTGRTGETGETGVTGNTGPEGPRGGSVSPEIEIDDDGVVGWISDATGTGVGGGIVYLVSSQDVDALADTTLDIIDRIDPDVVATELGDEPLEDLIDENGSDYQQAVVDDDGVYHFDSLEDGTYFVVWVPGDDDDAHLPGGSLCRSAVSGSSLRGTERDLRVSSRPADNATYVGSSLCMTCHGRHRVQRSAHFNTLQRPGRRGDNQDTTHWPDFDDPVEAFDSGADLYFYNCDEAQDPACEIWDTDPGSDVSFVAHLRRNTSIRREDPGAYYVTLENKAQAEPTVSHDVVLTLGGALHKQVFLARVATSSSGWSYVVLPFQYNYEGFDSLDESPRDRVWADYDSAAWYDFTTNALDQPGNDEAFDNRCAACHFNGFSLSRTSGSSPWIARAVADPKGAFDYDDDGREDEIAVGCESCHGPGSGHLEGAMFGSRIVSPRYLTPERELMICGRCHSRPKGIGGGGHDAPLAADHSMPRPGLRRSEFVVGYTQRVDGTSEDFYDSGDSMRQHQQYSDFLRSAMYRNGLMIMTCTSCHDPHGSDEHTSQLWFDPEENGGCTGCHATDELLNVEDHVDEQVGNALAHGDFGFKCVTCHMVKTVISAARRRQVLWGSSPPYDYYMHGDLSSHRFTVTRRADVTPLDQPLAASVACAACHPFVFLPQPP